MMSIFLAYGFRDQDRDLVNQVEQLLASHDVMRTTGEYLGGEAITSAVKERIIKADGLIALLTRRDQIAGDGWSTHQWVMDELNYARSQHKHGIAVIEDGVQIGGMYSEDERIAYDREKPLPTFLSLSHTIREWKKRTGRSIKIQILPEDLARKVGLGNGFQCFYRYFCGRDFKEWMNVQPVPEQGGTFINLDGFLEEYMIQLKIEEHQGTTWMSPAISQWMQIRLSRKEYG